jgi:hypothetical protein
MTAPRGGFGDAEARRIIARAAEIDAQRGQQLDANALREIAAEAGISPAAVDAAIEERFDAASTKPSWIRRHRWLLISAATIGLLLALLMMARTTGIGPH